MVHQRVHFVLAPELADQVAGGAILPAVIRPEAYVAVLSRALHGVSRARRRAVITSPLFELRLEVYRTTVLGRPYEIITRGDRLKRVVGVVPVTLRRRSRSRWDSELGEASPRERVSEREAQLLSLELLGAETEQELDQFLGKVFRKVGRLAQGVARGVTQVGKSIGKAVETVGKVVPLKALWNLSPIAMAGRLGKSIGRIARGENVFKVAGSFVKAGLKDVGQAVQLASTVASFVPGIGTGIGAALGAAGALAQGQPITEALIAAARGALPGGAIAAAAFDVASNLARGKSLSEAALAAARNQIPGGAAGRAAFDAGLALAQGKNLQQVALSTAGKMLPPSPFSASAVGFAQRLARGEKIQDAALSTAGKALLGKVKANIPAAKYGVPKRAAAAMAFAP